MSIRWDEFEPQGYEGMVSVSSTQSTLELKVLRESGR